MSESTEAVRLSVNIAPDVAVVIRQMAARRGVTVTELTRRAFSWLNYLDILEREGGKLLVDTHGDVREIRLEFR